MSQKYLKPTDPDAFLDFPGKLPVEAGRKECPKCQGYGGWNLKVFAYPLHQHENTQENRHNFCHFRSGCSNCNSWGSVPESQTCVHEWKETGRVGHCLHLWVCELCKQSRLVDSSD